MRQLRVTPLVALLLLALALPFQAFAFGDGAEEEVNTNPVTATVRFQPSSAEPGSTVEAFIDVQIADGFHAYSDKFKLSVLSHDDFKVAELKASPEIEFLDKSSGKKKVGLEKSGQVRAVIEIPKGFALGTLQTKLKFTYQACKEELCLFPKNIELSAPLAIVASTGGGKGGGPGGKEILAPSTKITQAPANEFDKALGHGIFFALFVVFGMGFLTSLTPCIYPMIPITLAVLGARTKGQSKLKSFSISFTYVLGLAMTYALLGVVAAKTGALFGSALSNVYVVTAIAFVFVAMGLSMYGLFEMQVPAFLRDKVGTAQTGSGYGGAFATGMIAGVVASPCVGPVLVSVLTYIAQTQNLVLGFAFLFTFAMGMGILFMVLGTSSNLISKVPKAGAWMDITKFVFGTAMIGMALFYVAPLYPTWLFNSLFGLAIILIASAYGAFEPNEKLEGAGRVRKGAMLAAFVIGLVFTLSGVLEKAGIAAPGAMMANGKAAGSYQKLAWKPYSDESLAEALKAKKPVLIDFYADWCGACKELEKHTFTDERIRTLSEKYALLKIDATEDFPGLDKLKSTYNVRGLPTMVFYGADGKIRPELTVTGFEDADKFLERMNSGLASTEQSGEISHSSVSGN
ncbi:MAG: protein-disulfide reductase DsbD [Bdellovibrionota bacterium]